MSVKTDCHTWHKKYKNALFKHMTSKYFDLASTYVLFPLLTFLFDSHCERTHCLFYLLPCTSDSANFCQCQSLSTVVPVTNGRGGRENLHVRMFDVCSFLIISELSADLIVL